MLETLDDDSIRRKLRELDAEIDKIEQKPPNKRRDWRKNNRKIWREKGKPGSWVMPLVWLFFGAQIVTIAFRLVVASGILKFVDDFPQWLCNS